MDNILQKLLGVRVLDYEEESVGEDHHLQLPIVVFRLLIRKMKIIKFPIILSIILLATV